MAEIESNPRVKKILDWVKAKPILALGLGILLGWILGAIVC